jgi:hypothetical protein
LLILLTPLVPETSNANPEIKMKRISPWFSEPPISENRNSASTISDSV